MNIRMPSPVSRPTSSNLQFRKRIPAQYVEHVRGKTAIFEIRGVNKPEVFLAHAKLTDEVKISLRTSDKQEAKARQAQVILQFEHFCKAHTSEITELSHRQLVALSRKPTTSTSITS